MTQENISINGIKFSVIGTFLGPNDELRRVTIKDEATFSGRFRKDTVKRLEGWSIGVKREDR